jgi:hypothetical protein
MFYCLFCSDKSYVVIRIFFFSFSLEAESLLPVYVLIYIEGLRVFVC